MVSSTPHRARPYWHVDMKWIFSLLALVALGAALLLYNLSALTERDKAITLSSTIVASLFSEGGLDDSTGLEEFRSMVVAMPGEYVAPIEQFPNVQISKQDALTLSPRELRIAIFSQITEPIYDKGLEGAAADFTQDPAEQEKFVNQASLLGVFTQSTHEDLKQAFFVSALLALVFIGAAIYFSAGIGRLVTPGILLLAASPIGSVISMLLTLPPKDTGSPFAAIPTIVSQEIGNSLYQSYVSASLLGLLLLAVAIVAKTVKSIRTRNI